MTFAQLLDQCRIRGNDDPIARAVLTLLGDLPTYGFEPPVVDKDMVTILDGSNDPQPAYQLTPKETRWFAVELLLAADEAESAA